MEKFSVFWYYTLLLSLTLCNSIWLSNRKHEKHKSSSPSCFFMRGGGTYTRWKNLQDYSFPSFFWWWLMSFGEFFIFCPCGGLLIPPAPRIWKTLTHLCRTTLVLQAKMLVPSRSLMSSPTCAWSPAAAAGAICFLHQRWLFLGHWETGLLDQAIRFWICWKEKKICYLYYGI